jgi:hypothetical protein
MDRFGLEMARIIRGLLMVSIPECESKDMHAKLAAEKNHNVIHYFLAKKPKLCRGS